jgi:cell division septation protein DedD
MISIQPANDAPREESPSEAAPSATAKEQMPMVWIPATICVGLLIAAIYLGGRIITANRHASVAVTAPVVVQPQPAPAPVTVVLVPAPPVPVVEAKSEPPAQPKPEATKPEPDTAAPLDLAEVPMITPKAGERYIQVGALDLEATRRYLGKLRQSKLEPHVAPGPKPELLRVLIGPFADRDSLTATKNDLESAGIENFIRQY